MTQEHVAIDKSILCIRFDTTQRTKNGKEQRHDDQHLERREVERLVTVKVVAYHIARSPEQFVDASQHRL